MHVLLTNELVQEAATSLRKDAGPLQDPAPGSGDAGTMPGHTGISPSSVSGDATVSQKSGTGTSTSFLRTCLVLVPKNVLRNWEDELKKVGKGELLEPKSLVEWSLCPHELTWLVLSLRSQFRGLP